MKNYESICNDIYELMTDEDKLNIYPPKLIISINGGLKKMKFKSNHHQKVFKQILLDIMDGKQIWIIGSGFNVGISKFVSKTAYEFRLHREDIENKVSLIGINTWGTIQNNKALRGMEANEGENISNTYRYSPSNMKGEVALDSLYDFFLFYDDSSKKQYDREAEFRLQFEKTVRDKTCGLLVQILFEGGGRAVKSALIALKNGTPVVVFNGSGRAADIISEVLKLPEKNLEENIIKILDNKEGTKQLSKSQKDEWKVDLKEIFKFQKQIIIYDMMDIKSYNREKFLERIISDAHENSHKEITCNLLQTLDLCIKFNCPSIADELVFSNSEYDKLSEWDNQFMFQKALENNRPEFVNLFIKNDFEVDKFINQHVLEKLYTLSLTSSKCKELLNDLLKSTKVTWCCNRKNDNSDSITLSEVGSMIEKLSGGLLDNLYKSYCYECSAFKLKDAIRGKKIHNHYTLSSQDLFLWALLSSQKDLSLMFWRASGDHVGSALMASIILRKMANLLLRRGENCLQSKILKASVEYEELALSIITDAYCKNRSKSYILIVRTLKRWNNLTCLQMAISRNLINFLNHSACRSYTTEIWMGEMSPLLSKWRIALSIPFPFLVKPLVMPTFNKKGSNLEIASYEAVQSRDKYISNFKNKNSKSIEDPLCTFYKAPIVKFYIHLFSYILFLTIFTYCNLVELNPLKQVVEIKNMMAEIYVYIYFLTFTIEELRQAFQQDICGLYNKLDIYFSGAWNIFDVVIICMFLISTITRFTLRDDLFMICRCLFSVTLCLFFIRSMQFYLISKTIGPKIIMIRNMLRDILFFLSIFAIFVMAYGTLAQALKHPNSVLGITLIKDIVYLPYFQTYGELMLESFEDSEPCNGTICSIKSGVVIFSFAVFLLSSNVLLINLLIAMFGYTFNKIQEDSENFWYFIRIQLVQEFYDKPVLPPPLNLLQYAFKPVTMIFANCFVKCRPERESNLFKKYLKDENDDKDISNFERFSMEAVLMEATN